MVKKPAMKWKILSSEYLFRDTWFTVRKDTCQTPSGKVISPYYVYEFPTWVTALAFTKDGRIILEKQYRHAIGETAWELPGGCVDREDASLEQAIARELMEETGYSFSGFEYIGKTCANPSTNSNWMHMFIAHGGELTGIPSLDPDEELEVDLVTMDELKRLLRDQQIIQSMHITAIFYALQKLGHFSI